LTEKQKNTYDQAKLVRDSLSFRNKTHNYT